MSIIGNLTLHIKVNVPKQLLCVVYVGVFRELVIVALH